MIDDMANKLKRFFNLDSFGKRFAQRNGLGTATRLPR
jgi:hypothetical protein